MPALLVVGDTFRRPEMRHEVPIGVPDACALIETDGVRLEDRVLVTDDGFENLTDFHYEMEL